jgi:cytochrome b561
LAPSASYGSIFLGENVEHAKALGLAREVRRQFVDCHISIGMIFLGPLAARVFWHLAHRQPRKPDQNVWLNRLSDLMIWDFLAMITVQIVTGPRIQWSAPRPLKIFDQTILPSPLSKRVEWLRYGGEFLHKRAPNLFWPLMALHIAGSLKHLLISRDGSFQLML